MKSCKKVLALALCAVMLVGATVMGTLAYLTSQDEVENTFVIGKLGITMDEYKVDELGNVLEPLTRVKQNDYKLMPGGEYVKDPVIHLQPGSEACYVYITVDNQLEGLITGLEEQILANDWVKFTDKNGDIVYYRDMVALDADADPLDMKTFYYFYVDEDVTAEDLAEYDAVDGVAPQINVNAYAIQSFDTGTAEEAWNNNFAK